MSNVASKINAIKQIAIDHIAVDKIFLFGSCAYGTPTESSDIDIFLVVKDHEMHTTSEIVDLMYSKISYEDFIPVDILAMKSSCFEVRKTQPTMERKIAREGVLLYDSKQP